MKMMEHWAAEGSCVPQGIAAGLAPVQVTGMEHVAVWLRVLRRGPVTFDLSVNLRLNGPAEGVKL